MKDDRIELEGKMYISSAEAAREMKYTKDYIGQLARAGKIDAKLIGRSWYVAEESLKEHKGSVHYTLTRAKKPRTSSGTRETEKAISRIDISAKGITSDEEENSENVPTHIVEDTPHELSPEIEEEHPDSNPEYFDPAPPLLVPIRTERKQPSRDVLLGSHIEYEPGEPLYFDDTRPAQQNTHRVARFQDTPIVHDRTRARSVIHHTEMPRMAVARSNTDVRMRSAAVSVRSPVRMDGVVLDARADRSLRQHPRYIASSESREEPLEEVYSYGKVVRKKGRRIPWGMILIGLFLLAGLGAIVWILFFV
jgi:hypothetical protein